MNRTAVVILNWNGRGLMRHYLPSVVRTSTAPGGVDVVVADNASTDGSLEMLRREFPAVRIVALDRNYGFAEGYNRALAELDNELVVLLNSDVEPAEGWLEPLVRLMDSDGRIGACGPTLLDDRDRRRFEYAGAAGGFIDALGYPFCRGRVLETVEEDRGQYAAPADCLWVSGAALMTRRALYVATGGLDADFFAHMEEIDYCWRLRNGGWRVVAAGGESRVFHLGGATLSNGNPRKTYLNFRNNLTMIVKNHASAAWWMVLLARMTLDGVAAARFLAVGEPRQLTAIARAHLHFWSRLGDALSKRRALRGGGGGELPAEVRRYSIVWRYYALRRKTFNTLDT